MYSSNYSKPEKFNDARDWFFDKRFGMFIHWGVYALTEWHEQQLWRTDITREEYEQLMYQFNPIEFDPDKWIDIAQSAGMEFMCFTTKHHDGFCMWDTKYTEYNIMNTPYNKDILKMLTDACARRGMDFGIYYSLPDWHHPNYPNKGRHHEMLFPRDTDEVDEDQYLEYVQNQVRELCENYGTITQFFWDVNVANFYKPEINDMIRTLQPKAIINNRGPSAGDYTTPERHVPEGGVFDKRVMAINSIGKESWSYRKDEDYYSHKFLMQSIDKIMAMGGNYMLNVGPTALGNISDEYTEALNKIGAWYSNIREAFDGAEPSSYILGNDTGMNAETGTSRYDSVLLTKKDRSIYVHVYQDLQSSGVMLHPLNNLPKRAVVLNNGQEIKSIVDVVPWRYQDRPALRLVNVPVNEITDEPIVIRLDF
jgi:alpha-L-fucosidase